VTQALEPRQCPAAQGKSALLRVRFFLSKKHFDKQVRALAKASLSVGTLSREIASHVGNGGISSPLPSNIAMSVFDEFRRRVGRRAAGKETGTTAKDSKCGDSVRCADDFVIFVRSDRRRAEALSEPDRSDLDPIGRACRSPD
jgi:hypothetical protein